MELARKSEVSNPQVSVVGVNEDVVWLDVSMHYSVRVQVREALKQLVTERLQNAFREVMSVDNGAEHCVFILEEQVDLLLLLQEVVAQKLNDVFMVQLLQNEEFSEHLRIDDGVLVVQLQFLQGEDVPGNSVSDLVHDSIGSFSQLLNLLKIFQLHPNY